ncbi:MAG: glycosyltransferase [Bacteroidota bacterium]
MEKEAITRVSVILLSFNGKAFLKDKIEFLLKEISFFESAELIVIDDGSTDGSIEILKRYPVSDSLKIIFNDKQHGIPYSMNLGVAKADHPYVIFCDQRQKLSSNILKRILEPMRREDVGAVSGCISSRDNKEQFSFIRTHENFMKSAESNAGSLIGVYGPFYAIRKHCYSPIPEYIILDDLYLSLRILKTKQIELINDCHIIDDNFSVLYDYQRTRRYLCGLLQLLKERTLISELSYQHWTMLIWHKYLRLIIPFLLSGCYVILGIAMTEGIAYVIAFILISLMAVLSVLPARMTFPFRFKNLLRINIFYFFAVHDILIDEIFKKK